MANTPNSHPFYLLCTQLTSNQSSIQNYVNSNLKEFFHQFADFLELYRKPIKSKLFQSSPLKTLTSVLDQAIIILSNSKFEDYSLDIKNDITICFKSLLHPRNNPEVRLKTLYLFFTLVDSLGENYESYSDEFYYCLIDYSLLKSEVGSSGFVTPAFDDKFRIILSNDTTTTSSSWCYKTIETILQHALDIKVSSSFVIWWKIIQKLVLSVFYSNISKQLNLPNVKSCLLGQCPQKVNSMILNFILNILQKDDQLIHQVFNCEHTPIFLIYILEETCNKYLNEKESMYNIIINITERYIQDKYLITLLFDKQYHLLLKLMTIILHLFDYIFSIQNEEQITLLSNLFNKYFKDLYLKFTEPLRKELCTLITTFKYILSNKSKNLIHCIFHIYTLLFSLFINNEIQSLDLWKILVDSGSQQRLLTLSLYGYLSSYYSIILSPILLKFDLNKLSDSNTATFSYKNWILNHGIWENEFSSWINGDVKMFYKENEEQLTPKENFVNSAIKQIRLPNLEIKNWDYTKALNNINSMFKAFNCFDINDNDDLQFKIYLVNSSFIYTLQKLTEVFPFTFQYDYSFLLKEFMNWLRECLIKTTNNTKIILHSLNLLGNIICKVTSIPLLNDEILTDWYLTLNYWITSNKTENIRLCALAFASKSIILGFHGSQLLLYTISNNFTNNSTKIGNEITQLSEKENASIIIALNSINEISNDNNFGENISKKIIKQNLMKSIDKIEYDFQFQILITILIEESIFHRELLINGLIQNIIALLDKRNIIDLYIFYPIILILSDLENTQNGSIKKLLNAFLNTLEVCTADINNNNEEYIISLIKIIADLIIYSASIIDVSEFFNKFENSTLNWNLEQENCVFTKETSQQILYILMYFSANFLKFIIPNSNPLNLNSKASAVFGGTYDYIYKVSEKQLYIEKPTGKYIWNFKNIAENPIQRKLSENANIDEKLPNPIEYEKQKTFESKLTNYFNDLYDNQLKSFGVDDKLYKPNNELYPKVSQSNNKFEIPSAQKLPPSYVGHSSVSFLRSMSFFENISTERLFPSWENDLTIDEITEFKHKIIVSLISKRGVYPHFEDFKCGLGYITNESNDIIYSDYSHEIIFKNEIMEGKAQIVWNEGFNENEFILTFYQKSLLNIIIQPHSNGLFLVKVLIHKNFDNSINQIKETLISKEALPVFVIAQILSISHIIDYKMKDVKRPFLMNGKEIRKIRKSSKFCQNPMILQCPKTLFENTNQNDVNE